MDARSYLESGEFEMALIEHHDHSDHPHTTSKSYTQLN